MECFRARLLHAVYVFSCSIFAFCALFIRGSESCNAVWSSRNQHNNQLTWYIIMLFASWLKWSPGTFSSTWFCGWIQFIIILVVRCRVPAGFQFNRFPCPTAVDVLRGLQQIRQEFTLSMHNILLSILKSQAVSATVNILHSSPKR